MPDHRRESSTASRPLLGERDSGRPMRNTRQRQAIVDALAARSSFISAQQLHADLRDSGEGIGLSTVYRTLQSLAANAEVDMVLREDGEAVYRRCGDGHHHHLVCRRCGFTVEVEGPSVERWAHSVASKNGFSQVNHTIEIIGLCQTCGSNERLMPT